MTDELIRLSDALALFDGPDTCPIQFDYGEARDRIAALPAVTVGVKPLVWQHEARNGWKVGVAWTTGYHIIRRDDGWHYGNGAGGIFPTIEAAKAAAQADYTDRVLSALEHAAPDPAAIREAALEIWKHANSRDPDDPVFIAAILALIPTKATADPAVNAPDYILAPHFQRIVEGAKNAPQWDTVSDRMAATDPTEYERKVAQMKEDFPNGI